MSQRVFPQTLSSLIHASLFRRLFVRGLLFSCCAGFGLPFGMEGCIPVDPTPDPDPNPEVRLFQAMMKYPAGEEPFDLLGEDVNGDGARDLLVVNRVGNTLSVLLKKAEGGYKEHVDYPVGEAPSALACGDLTGDGLLDVLTANYDSHDLSLLPGAAEGAFDAETRIALVDQATPLAVALGDINADGHLDIAAANYGLETLATLLGQGAGVFAAPQEWPVGSNPRSVQLVDLNGDATLDLLCANRNSDSISILYGLGDGAFESAQHLTCGEAPRMAIAKDLNQDTLVDMVVTNTGTQDISVFLALPAGGYAAEVRYALADTPTRLLIEDLTGDGAPDLATLLFSTDETSTPLGVTALLENDGAGAFSDPRFYGSGLRARGLHCADMDGDGRQDLITADTSQNQVSICFGKADGSFETDERFKVGDHPRLVLVEDFDGDGKLDALVNNLDEKSLSLLFGTGDGRFEPAQRIAVSDVPRAMAIADFNADHNPDVVVTNLYTSRISVFLNTGNGSFEEEKRFLCKDPGEADSAYPRSVAVEDVNGDGALDIVTGNTAIDSIGILLGNGAGSFSLGAECYIANYPLALHLADINRDALMDYLCVSTNDPNNQNDTAEPRIVRALNPGQVTFDKDAIKRYTTGDGPKDLAVADLNNDGNPDAVSVHTSDDSVYILRGRADGSFVDATRKRTIEAPNGVHLADINLDGYGDILACTPYGIVGVLLGQGGLSFQSAFSLFIGDQSYGVTTADLNEDGRVDLLLVNQSSNDLAVLLGAP